MAVYESAHFMYKKHPRLNCWVSEDGFLMKKPRYKYDSGERKISVSRTGYAFVSANGTCHYVHRIVYEAFYGEIPKGLQVNHINGVKLDNRLRNLELMTASENIRHAVRTGLKPGSPAETNSMAKLANEDYCLLIADIMAGLTNDQIAEKYGLHSRYVSLIRGKRRLKTIWQKYESIHGSHPVPVSDGCGQYSLSVRLNLLRELSSFSNKDLARQYNLDPSSVSHIRGKRMWKSTWDVFEVRSND